MKTINRTLTILTLVVLGFVAGSVHLVQRNFKLKDALERNRQACEQRMSELESDYQARIDQLKEYLLAQYDSKEQTAVQPEEEQDELEAAKPKLAAYDESLEELVMRKYRFLFSHVDLSEADRLKLKQLLLERERINLKIQDAKNYEEMRNDVDIQQLEIQLAEIDEQIRTLLDSENGERFVLLRDSEEEQHDFTQYTLGVNGIFPLTEEQQEKVLFAKLKYKDKFEQALQSAGLYNNYPLTEEQRNQLLADVKKAVGEYKYRFLVEVQQSLDDSNEYFDQYTLLENYETTEFNNLLKDLQEQIDRRTE